MYRNYKFWSNTGFDTLSSDCVNIFWNTYIWSTSFDSVSPLLLLMPANCPCPGWTNIWTRDLWQTTWAEFRMKSWQIWTGVSKQRGINVSKSMLNKQMNVNKAKLQNIKWKLVVLSDLLHHPSPGTRRAKSGWNARHPRQANAHLSLSQLETGHSWQDTNKQPVNRETPRALAIFRATFLSINGHKPRPEIVLFRSFFSEKYFCYNFFWEFFGQLATWSIIKTRISTHLYT